MEYPSKSNFHKTLYDILGLTPQASTDEIKSTYRKIVLKHHPDKGGNAEAFRELTHAYSVLSDPEQRSLYDTTMQYGCGEEKANFYRAAGFDDVREIFEMFFASAPFQDQHESHAQKDDDFILDTPLHVVRNGGSITIHPCVHDPCPSCSDRRSCPTCKGTGYVTHAIGLSLAIRSPCAMCGGTGLRNKGNLGCSTCNDLGVVNSDRSIKITLPAGVKNNRIIRIMDQGSFDPLSRKRKPLAVRIKYSTLPHEEVDPDGSGDVILTIPVSLGEVLTGFVGGEKIVRSLGNTFRVACPNYKDPTEKVVMKGFGLPIDEDSDQNGDVIIKFQVIWPNSNSRDSEHDKKIIKNLSKFSDPLRKIFRCS